MVSLENVDITYEIWSNTLTLVVHFKKALQLAYFIFLFINFIRDFNENDYGNILC